MSAGQFLPIFYVFFWLIRIEGCFRRGRQPLSGGPEWFFDVRVQPDFYGGAGRQILHRYWLRMLIPFAADIPLAIAVFLSGSPKLAIGMIMGLCAWIHVNHAFSVDLAERQARRFAVPQAEQPATRLVVSLQPRRLRNYTNLNL